MCFRIDYSLTEKLRETPPRYGWRVYSYAGAETPYKLTPLKAGILKADRGPWSKQSWRHNTAAHGIYLYRTRNAALLYPERTVVVRATILGRIRFASSSMLTCDAIEINEAAVKRALKKIKEAAV